MLSPAATLAGSVMVDMWKTPVPLQISLHLESPRKLRQPRRESGGAVEASETTSVVPEAIFSPPVFEGNLATVGAGRVGELGLSGDELGSPSGNLEEGERCAQTVGTGDGNMVPRVPESGTLFHKCELCFGAFRRKRASSSSSSLAACDFLRPGSARVPATTRDPWEVDLDLLHQSGPGLLTEGAGDSVGLLPVGNGAVAESSPAVSSTGTCEVPGHGSLPDLKPSLAPGKETMLPTTSRSAGGPDSCSWQTAWSFRLRRRPIMVALSPLASPSSGDSLNSETWNPDSTHGHPSARESLRQAAASSLRGERLWRGDLVVGGQLCTPGPGNPDSYRKPIWGRRGVQLQKGDDRERQPGTSLREDLIRAQREAVGREPPETFQGQRLWAIAGEAISGDDFLRPINDYIRNVFFLNQRRLAGGGAGAESRTQDFFHKRPADCAREVLDVPAEAGPNGEICIFFPDTAKEFREARLPLNSAPGLDGFTARLLRTVPPTILRVLLNLLMLLGRVPAALQAGRTVLIPKSSPATEAGHFRPITVAPVIQRLLHKVLAQRFTAANELLLATAIAKAKQLLRPLYMASVDLTKAFDRVSTKAIVPGAVRAGLADNFGESLLVKPTTGVLQGDPLSPTVFNLVLDEYLTTTDNNVGFTSGEFRLNAMDFAVDLLVFASTRRGLQERLNELAEFLEPRGLRVNVAKSFILVLQPSGREKKLKVETDPAFCIRGQPLSVVTTATIWRYMAVQFSSQGRIRGVVDRDLRELIEKVTRAPLKPQQRLFILRGFLLPRLHHRLVLGL
ncbi:hypothetical protein HPB47_021795 [Ixodes persulcatus]|uniref:Uncharacterized protein n=1 Tax=Ixodes persulcatus TaxID=34615 RepID=A0AC60QCI4_IXOPE|nr:hypothetical protein HPB47_021795 [Ixodes persulcatus]